MWRINKLKVKAKKHLKGNYWRALFVSFIIFITGGSHNNYISRASGTIEVGGLYIILIILLLLLIRFVLEVGGRKYYIKLLEGKNQSKISYLVYGFRMNKYFNIFLPMILRTVYIILWTLLFIIPGIIKLYAYRMVPYILADNSKIGYKRAIELSNQMTQGEKWYIFMLDFSFLGWFILGILLFGVGILFVQPYYDATNAELYLKLRKNAIANDLTSNKELNINK